ncbi:MAG: NAD(P)-binding domain-containing protein, partial [Luteibacter sp.]
MGLGLGARRGPGRLTGASVMRIGFIGLGSMGAGMAANLIKGGHEVTVW